MVIFNQSILTGTFPDKMKIAEIIPLYKGKERDEVINYRPIMEWLKKSLNNVGGLLGQHCQLKLIGTSKIEK